jgi:hypothetical protein
MLTLLFLAPIPAQAEFVEVTDDLGSLWTGCGLG